MTSAPTTVRIRTARHNWAWLVVFSVWQLTVATWYFVSDSAAWAGGARGWPAWFWLTLGAVTGVGALWYRTLGVDLTTESAVVRGIRRQTVPRHDVRAVVPALRIGETSVRLVLSSGKTLVLRAPRTLWGFGRADYQRDFHRIDQWRLARPDLDAPRRCQDDA